MTKLTLDSFPLIANEPADQVADIKAYAAANYERHGWDFVVECYDDAAILEAIGKRKNSRSAIMAMYAIVKPQDDARKEARAAGGVGEDAAAAKAEAAAPEATNIEKLGTALQANADDAAAAKRAHKAKLARDRRAAKKANA